MQYGNDAVYGWILMSKFQRLLFALQLAQDSAKAYLSEHELNIYTYCFEPTEITIYIGFMKIKIKHAN